MKQPQEGRRGREEERKLGKKEISVGRMPGITKVLSQITTYVVGLFSGTYIRKRKRGRESCFRSDDSCEILD